MNCTEHERLCGGELDGEWCAHPLSDTRLFVAIKYRVPVKMQGPCACGVCGGRDGHSARRCPELVAPLHQEGFFRPPGGRPQGGEDDDERAGVAVCKKLNDGRSWQPLRIGRHLVTTTTRWPPSAITTVPSVMRR